ncbi:MAG: Fis family transcriptional regulator [Candidatus Accumulibacter sp. 66-26]|nr:sigma 54-interacting transcriptional regulator [Accumulibacter sp.]OJW49262.1 MAG: Fis family transcriptional regulator [Candidatus Accumulibacter sp. 66-26]
MSAAPSLPSELIAFLENSGEPAIVMDAEYRIVAANGAYRQEFAGGQPIRGRTCYEVSHRFNVPCDQAGEACPLKLSRESGTPQRVLHMHHTPRGEEHVDVATTPIRNAAGQVVYFVEEMRRVRQASSRPAAQGLVGRAPRFLAMLEQVLRVAPVDAAVLLLGETGTGKELVARAIHEASPRNGGAFVAVDCAGLSETLFESELFGHEKGAFTGASHRKLGLVEAASGGTLFLDEIGDLPLALQVKLLRLLETASYRRVGGLDTLPADFRLIAATHRDLAAMVADGSFRRDLYYRLNVFPIHTPALHERADDIPLLANSLLERVDRKPGRRFAAGALAWLEKRRYAGNIRELRNLIERATLMSDGDVLNAGDLRAVDEAAPPPAAAHAFTVAETIPLAELERRYLGWAANAGTNDLPRLAGQLGVSLRTLYRKLREAGRG